MQQYLDLVSHVINHGMRMADRTGTGTRPVFGYRMRFDPAKGFSRHLHVSGWKPADIPQITPAPCPCPFKFHAGENPQAVRRLSCHACQHCVDVYPDERITAHMPLCYRQPEHRVSVH